MTADGTYSLEALAVPAPLRPFAAEHLKSPRPLVRIAEMLSMPALVKSLDPAEIVACAVALRRATPDDRLVWALTTGVTDARVAPWHWNIIADHQRNTAYDAAARALIEPGMTVLEIGSGTGILSMMAARAGADHVYTIEVTPQMAHVARACIAANGYSDRITVIEADALQVETEVQIPHRAQALIHEIMSTDLVSQNILRLVGHAKDSLLEPGAVLLPDTIWADGALVGPREEKPRDRETTTGFDLTPLEVMSRPARYEKGFDPDTWLSNPVRLIGIDLKTAPADLRQSAEVTLTATDAGTAGGIAQWPGFSFPDGTIFDGNHPKSCWGRLYHDLPGPLEVTKGTAMVLRIDQLPTKLALSPSLDLAVP